MPIEFRDDTERSTSASAAPALLALGFRPFFLAAMLAAVGLMLPWIARYIGWLGFQGYYGAVLWHAHEMLFGFTAAVMAGFLLTAVGRWTQSPMPSGATLAGLVALWLAGRVLPFAPSALPAWLVAGVDLAFLPALALALAAPLVRRGATRNLVFVPALLVFAAANALLHIGRARGDAMIALRGAQLGVDVVVLLIAIIGGRVIPYFTERALPEAAPRKWPAAEALALGSLVGFAIARLASAPAALLAALALLAAASHAVRLAGWRARGVFATPLLWVLHLGYAWIPVGFALTAGAALGRVSPFVALHAFTTGAIGSMTLGMMARVSLGHTGRALRPARAVTLAFGLVNLAAAVRVFGPLLAPARRTELVALSGLLWVAAFGIGFVCHAGMLSRARPDGQPG
jgi:uncharacterized protein involved in response to NO